LQVVWKKYKIFKYKNVSSKFISLSIKIYKADPSRWFFNFCAPIRTILIIIVVLIYCAICQLSFTAKWAASELYTGNILIFPQLCLSILMTVEKIPHSFDLLRCFLLMKKNSHNIHMTMIFDTFINNFLNDLIITTQKKRKKKRL
jgi:hypothetical protein